MNLNNMLDKLDSYPFHMPGHKRNICFGVPSSDIDITEIDGFDNLHNPTGILKELQDRCADIFDQKQSILSVNGSTCCVLAAILAVSHKGDDIIIARNCHKSVYNACYLNELNIHYIEPEFDYEFGCYREITQKSVELALNKHKNACAVVITSPTYEGIVSNLCTNIPLIVDSAHGAHFGFADYLPDRIHADIVIQSLHKTLPCLTQTAVIHINNSELYTKVKMYMDMLETSSPSYILLSSIEKCLDFAENCNESYEKYKILLNDFYKFIHNKNNVKLLNNDDITRIIMKVDGYTGAQLSDILRKDYGIEAEGATLNYVILISTVCDTKEGFDKLRNAIDNIAYKGSENISLEKPPIPEKYCKPNEIRNTEQCEFENCEGRICAEYVYAYPPGAPLIVPGEIISREMIEYIKSCIDNGVNILSDSNIIPSKILTKA